MSVAIEHLLKALSQPIITPPPEPFAPICLPLITLSRSCGSGGERVAQQVAERLGLEVYDKQIIDAVAREAHQDTYLMARLDERSNHATSSWLSRFLGNQEIERERYFRSLVKVVVSLSQIGGIIVGRGANFILGETCGLHVRITGSIERCAHELVEAEHVSLDAAYAQARQTDGDRAGFIRDFFAVDINDLRYYDVGLNTDKLSTVQCADLVILAFQQLNPPDRPS